MTRARVPDAAKSTSAVAFLRPKLFCLSDLRHDARRLDEAFDARSRVEAVAAHAMLFHQRDLGPHGGGDVGPTSPAEPAPITTRLRRTSLG